MTNKKRNLTAAAHLTVSAFAIGGIAWALIAPGHAWHGVLQWGAVGVMLLLLLSLTMESEEK